eukprot:324320-Hanusia_phi.AAC.4
MRWQSSCLLSEPQRRVAEYHSGSQSERTCQSADDSGQGLKRFDNCMFGIFPAAASLSPEPTRCSEKNPCQAMTGHSRNRDSEADPEEDTPHQGKVDMEGCGTYGAGGGGAY